MMTAAIPSISRSVAAIGLISRRQLSTSCTESVDKLKNILENYRTTNYSREMPKRFRSDIAKIACTRSSPLLSAASANAAVGVVSAEGIACVLNNIGAGGSMTRSEIESMLREIGDHDVSEQDSYVISVDQMLDLISTNKPM